MSVSLYLGCLQTLLVVSLLMTISTNIYVTLSCVSSNTVGRFTFNDNIYKCLCHFIFCVFKILLIVSLLMTISPIVYVTFTFCFLQMLLVGSLLMTISQIVYVTFTSCFADIVGRFTFNDSISNVLSLYLVCLETTLVGSLIVTISTNVFVTVSCVI